MSHLVNYLNQIYNDATIKSILDFAINGKCEIHFLNKVTNVPQPLTPVQLMGIKKFGGVNILLETGQTYQIGLEMNQVKGLTYQEVYFSDLIVDNTTLGLIKKEFGRS